MNPNLYFAQERRIEVQREADRRARAVRPIRTKRSLRDRLRSDRGC